jgi:hypothetical protein
MTDHDTFAVAERVADAVLYEGYVLYPYRASAAKNQLRWQFGVLAPAAPRNDGEPSCSQTECLVERGAVLPRLSVRVRCLRPCATEVDRDARPWLEGVKTTMDAIVAMPIGVAPIERVVFLSESGVDLRLAVHTCEAGPFVKLRLVLENRDPWRPEFASDRDAMLARSLVGTHLLLAIDDGSFVSLLEPPEPAAALAAACENRHTWPVLVGDRPQRTLMLSSPIVLYDYPSVAKESPGDLCDAAEIDEILSLRILTLTDEEKEEARATDPLARAILDRVEKLRPEAFTALHGSLRGADFFNPPDALPPEDAGVLVEGRRITKGSHVRLRPNRRADAMDMFLKDQPATVAGVYHDLDDRVYVAVTVDIDPAAALHDSFGRYFYFDPAEVELIEETV